MLHHEQTLENAPVSYSPVDTPPVTPHELAQAVVAVEERQGSGPQIKVESAVIAQTHARSELQITPQRLPEEAQAQRNITHQDATVTRSKTRDPAFWLMMSGAIATFTAVIALLVVNYTLLCKLQASHNMLLITQSASKALVTQQAPSVQTAAPVNGKQILERYIYHDTSKLAVRIQGETLASWDTTTTDSYETVWNYYAGKMCMGVRQPGPQPPEMDIRGVGFTTGQNGKKQARSWDLWKTTSADHMTRFTYHTAEYTISGILLYNPATRETDIHLMATTP